MPRRPRVHLDGVPLHIVQRGHNRQPCFFAEGDYGSYLHWLDEALRETTCALHAYVLMTNHVHLLLTPTKAEAVPKLRVYEKSLPKIQPCQTLLRVDGRTVLRRRCL